VKLILLAAGKRLNIPFYRIERLMNIGGYGKDVRVFKSYRVKRRVADSYDKGNEKSLREGNGRFYIKTAFFRKTDSQFRPYLDPHSPISS